MTPSSSILSSLTTGEVKLLLRALSSYALSEEGIEEAERVEEVSSLLTRSITHKPSIVRVEWFLEGDRINFRVLNGYAHNPSEIFQKFLEERGIGGNWSVPSYVRRVSDGMYLEYTTHRVYAKDVVKKEVSEKKVKKAKDSVQKSMQLLSKEDKEKFLSELKKQIFGG